MNSPWLSTQQAAEYLGFSVWTIRRLRNAGHIREHRAPGVDSPRFHRGDLDKLMTQKHEKQSSTGTYGAVGSGSSTARTSTPNAQGCPGKMAAMVPQDGGVFDVQR